MKFHFLTTHLLILFITVISSAADPVALMTTPDGGIQPKALTDPAGTTHLLYYKGESGGGDLVHATKARDATEFTAAKRVNSQRRSAVSAGTIRGGQFALGKENRVHVVWNGAGATKENHPPLYYSRSDGSGFEPQRAMSGDWTMDGGGAVAADKTGNVYVFYHGGRKGGGHHGGESSRRVIVRVSHDDGATFASEQIISPEGLGVCGCCAMQAYADAQGRVFAIYRTASNGGKDRDIGCLFSADKGATWQHSIADKWSIAACPMSSMSIATAAGRVCFSWENNGKILLGQWDDSAGKIANVMTLPGAAKGRKHPVITNDASGKGAFIVWTEGTGWQRGGALAWQRLDENFKPTAASFAPLRDGIAMWSFAAPFVSADGGMVIVH